MNSSVKIEPGFRGIVTGLTRSAAYQRVSFSMKNNNGRVLASSTLLGNGENIPMKQEVNGMQVWTFGPFNEVMTMLLTVENGSSPEGNFVPSKSILPITVRKEPDAQTPQTYIVSTMLSEDAIDNDYNDAIITIFQFK